MDIINKFVNYDAYIDWLHKDIGEFYKSKSHLRNVRTLTGLSQDYASMILRLLTLSDRTMLMIALYPFLDRNIRNKIEDIGGFAEIYECSMSYGKLELCNWLDSSYDFQHHIDMLVTAPRRLAYHGRTNDLITMFAEIEGRWSVGEGIEYRPMIFFAIAGRHLDTADYLWKAGSQISASTLSFAIADKYKEGVEWIIARWKKCRCGNDVELYFDRCDYCRSCDDDGEGQILAVDQSTDDPIWDCCDAIAETNYVPEQFTEFMTRRVIEKITIACYINASVNIKTWLCKLHPTQYELDCLYDVPIQSTSHKDIYQILMEVEITGVMIDNPNLQIDGWSFDGPDYTHHEELKMHPGYIQCYPYRVTLLTAGCKHYCNKFYQRVEFREEANRLKPVYDIAMAMIERLKILLSGRNVPFCADQFRNIYRYVVKIEEDLIRVYNKLTTNKIPRTE